MQYAITKPKLQTFNNMKITQITYQESRQISDGLWSKVEWVAELSLHETPETSTTELKERVDNWFNETYNNQHKPTTTEEQQLLQIPIEQRWIDSINYCKTLSDLDEIKFIKNSSKEKIRQAYENKYNELKNK